ncbi:uncharacterized protein LOC122011483 [Zingiber officinale]|uniref:SPRY domain-containing protein n=1 Tax=Zingiber officinale TaxID=94328 RepID=A0A8J5FGK0_ZINOF|nr:uncharacterized protein LOC122011483 [Zingiber officinale]KAG6485228.1 hypothetical protein ZIOFF_053761 [Zingiber officinale]
MKLWVKILAPSIASAFLLLLLSIFLWYRRCRQFSSLETPQFPQSASRARTQSLQAGIAKLHLSFRTSTHSTAGSESALATFSWDDHPRLVGEAVEHGWSRFTFSSGQPPCRRFAHPCDSGSGETKWEVPLGSLEFSQTVELHPRERSLHGEDVSTARMLLPLPGPPLGVSSFPKEAYFEITVLDLKKPPPPQQQWTFPRENKRTKAADVVEEADSAKLISENSFKSHAVLPCASDVIVTPIPETKAYAEEEECRNQINNTILVSLGLTHGGTLPGGSFSGTYPGSIGFHSNGRVFLDGTMLVFESEKSGWAEVNRVIGCGFDSRKKKVFFTVDSELMHVIHCSSDIYKAPMFPIIASNTDATILINLGQSRFKYEPANVQRTSNPCFIGSSSLDRSGATIGEDDSRELFSMGRIDPQWFDAVKKSQNSTKNTVNQNDASYLVDVDADSDLFEISLRI